MKGVRNFLWPGAGCLLSDPFCDVSFMNPLLPSLWLVFPLLRAYSPHTRKIRRTPLGRWDTGTSTTSHNDYDASPALCSGMKYELAKNNHQARLRYFRRSCVGIWPPSVFSITHCAKEISISKIPMAVIIALLPHLQFLTSSAGPSSMMGRFFLPSCTRRPFGHQHPT